MNAIKITHKIEETINGNFIVIIRNYFRNNIYTRKVKYGFKSIVKFIYKSIHVYTSNRNSPRQKPILIYK
jgi:hypothetical protein